MRLSIPFVLSTAIVFGMSHMMTVSAIPNNSQGSGNHDNSERSSADKPKVTVLPPVFPTEGMRGDYRELRIPVGEFNKQRRSPPHFDHSDDPRVQKQFEEIWKHLDVTQKIILEDLQGVGKSAPKDFPPPTNRPGHLVLEDVLAKCDYVEGLAGRYEAAREGRPPPAFPTTANREHESFAPLPEEVNPLPRLKALAYRIAAWPRRWP
ncbi:hypothetical protein BC835DRAFT_1373022 [Cytidiella melzeri]|nr:hypothetical protein BC835DRAFT_1373022 [Cytidiella melzeri]